MQPRRPFRWPPLYYRNLQTCLQEALQEDQNYSSTTVLTKEVREELEWWRDHFTQWNGRSLIAHNSSLTIETDALKKGGGTVWNGVAQNKSDHSPQDGQYVSTDVHQQARGMISTQLNKPSQRGLWCMKRSIFLKAQYLAGVLNTIADDKSRDWKLPSSLLANQSEAGPSGGRPVYQQVNLSTEAVCQLETTSDSNSHGCIHFGLGRVESIRQPAVEPDQLASV